MQGGPTRRGRAVAAALLASLAPWTALAQPAAPAQPAPAQPPPASAQPAPAPAPPPADAAPPPEDKPVSPETKREARGHFEKGLALLREEAWAPALAEFLLSRSLFPTRAATNNAAIALRKLQRYDEALDTFETYLRDFQVPPNDRAAAQKEIADLRALVGTLDVTGAEPGASIVVSGEDRGEYPPVKPIRVAAGAHIVRVFKEGYQPFEARIDVAGGTTVSVPVKLQRLNRSGRLRVTEGTGKSVDVLVDNVVMGQTPWEGVLSVGDHMVTLRGQGKLGTQPTAARVRPQQLTALSLLAEELDASLRVDPTPPGASVWINSVNVGNGVWLGRLKAGQHRVEVKTDGFLPVARTVALQKGQRETLTMQLERDDDAPLWRKPSKITFDVSTSFVLAPTFGGDVAGGCTGDCSRSLGLGGLMLLHGGYELGTGFGIGAQAGFLLATQDVTGRAGSLTPHGLDPNSGTLDDALRLTAFIGGATAGYHFGQSLPVLLRLGAGVVVGEVRSERSGTFETTAGTLFNADPATDFQSATYFYAAPEIRVGTRFAGSFELSLGVQALMMFALSQPKWDKTIELPASTDGIGTYPDESLMGSFVLMLAPGASLRYDF